MSNFYSAVGGPGMTTKFEVTDEKRVLLLCDSGSKVDVTDFTLLASDFTDPEDALVDLYTDDGTEPGISITKKEN